MTDTTTVTSKTINTVLGPVPADELGVVAVHEALLSVVPGAEHAYDITMDRAEIFEILANLTPGHGGEKTEPALHGARPTAGRISGKSFPSKPSWFVAPASPAIRCKA